ncbi:iron chelate uptake ABC transporter family permease subunit [Luteimicrobium xylanilyticum]|uniref:Ferric enterobactin transport system permease protein n=1 Tax=Luteimicrobium xylanilyticum TaxID=1133546 RepID=A0A5P9QBB2_9MICO|nr:iron ABC transporter permease [Luteimicrobium xylanilyticum]QFU98410.1 Ferric enterobactin transport system permease protein [Luteimicrobium xylanilyticum]
MPQVPRARGRTVVVLASLAALVVAATLLSLAVGARSIPLPDVLHALTGGHATDDAVVVTSQRLPRTLVALGAGAALGAAGALMQGHVRNPLADPGLFGVNAGAALGVAVLVFVLGVDAPGAVVAAALVGAAAAASVLFVLGLRSLQGGAVVLLAVLGTSLAAFLGAITSSFVLLDRQTLDVMRFWQVGSVAGRDTSAAALVLPLVVCGLVLALANGFSLRSLGLGEDVARTLGTRVVRARVVGIGAVTLLAGAATAVCGPISFVGLVAPHLARRLTGHDYAALVPAAALAGAAVLLLADTAGRIVAPPGELQAGIVMAVIGAPILLAVARRRRVVAL